MYRQNKWCPVHLQLIHFALSAVLNQKPFSLYFLVYMMHNKKNLSEYDTAQIRSVLWITEAKGFIFIPTMMINFGGFEDKYSHSMKLHMIWFPKKLHFRILFPELA